MGEMSEKLAAAQLKGHRVITGDYRGGLDDEALAWIEHASVYHAPTPAAIAAHAAVAQGCQDFLATILLNCPPSADRTRALNMARDARMVANSSIALEE